MELGLVLGSLALLLPLPVEVEVEVVDIFGVAGEGVE